MTDTTTLNQRVIARILDCKNQRVHPRYQKHIDGLFEFSQACSYFNIRGFEFPNIEGIDMDYYEHTMSFVHFVGCSSFKMYFVGMKGGEWYGIEYDVPAFEVTCNKLSDNFSFNGMKWGWEPDPVYVYEGTSHEISGHTYFYFSDVTPEESNDILSDYEESINVANGETLYLVMAEDGDYIHRICSRKEEAESIVSCENIRSMNDSEFNLGTEFYVRRITVQLYKQYLYES